jgi:hypothetical protein
MAIKWTPELEEAICRAIAITPIGLEHICKANPEFPSPDAIQDRKRKDESFCGKYAHAKADQVMILAEQIIDIADDSHSDTLEDEDGNVMVNREVIERTKIRIDARKWLASKLAPKIYGDKTAITGDGGGPLQIITSIPRPPK